MHTSIPIRNARTISIYFLFCNPVEIYEVWSIQYEVWTTRKWALSMFWNTLNFRPSTTLYGKNRAVRVAGHVFSWRTSLAPTDGSETRGFCMHGHDLASDSQGYFGQTTSKKYAYAANLHQDKLADFNDGVFFERSTNSSERVNLNSAL